MNLELILKCVAEDFRNAILQSNLNELPPTMHHFPYGACGSTSRMLGYHLDMLGLGESLYICGTTPKNYSKPGSHAWLENGDFAVDITGSQFRFIVDEITICPVIEHRNRFQDCTAIPYWGNYDGSYGKVKQSLEKDRLWSSYQEILKHCELHSLDEIDNLFRM